jgi:hypothetical protein
MILVVSFARSSGLIKKYWYLSLSSRRVSVFHLLVEVSAGILISASFKSRKYPHDFFYSLAGEPATVLHSAEEKTGFLLHRHRTGKNWRCQPGCPE